jgi:integrase
MSVNPKQSSQIAERWQWPIDLSRYDRTPMLYAEEVRALAERRRAIAVCYPNRVRVWNVLLRRLTTPLHDALCVGNIPVVPRQAMVSWMVREMEQHGTTFWMWTTQEWIDVIDNISDASLRQRLLLMSYLLCGFRDFHALKTRPKLWMLAHAVFGSAWLEPAIQRVTAQLEAWGYCDTHTMYRALMYILLINRSPYLEDLSVDILLTIRERHLPKALQYTVGTLSRVLVNFGILPTTLDFKVPGDVRQRYTPRIHSIAPEWRAWVQRWYDTTTLQPTTRKAYRSLLIRIGYWLAQTHPEITHPDQWTRELAAAFVAAVVRLRVGDWTVAVRPTAEDGKPVTARTMDNYVRTASTFFQSLQDWEWIRIRFSPRRCFVLPRAIKAQLGPNPRDIASDIWAKLLWAGLNVTPEDLPTMSGTGMFYPLELVQAVAITWLFAGLRANELRRLRVGCVRWQREDVTLPVTGEHLPKDSVCFLDVPVNKTSAPFTKPVDRYVGLAIEAWERVRPKQSLTVDHKAGERVNYLFHYRGKLLGSSYINQTLIPMLCRKIGLPEEDAKGNITSHRARSTIATQLYNAKEPMTLEELQAWLGHATPETTRHYAKITPTKLAKSFADAGYFERNMRMISVLIDQHAVLNGDAANGLPWKYYDLGHGYCTYDFFEQCEHRMACAHCGYYRPKNAFLTLLEEKKQHLLYMKQDVPLTELELATVEGDLEATEQLIAQLLDVPTPAGPTPRHLREASSECGTSNV